MTSDTYRKRYKMNAVGNKGQTITVAIPHEVIESNALIHNMSPEDFVNKFHAIAKYTDSGEISYSFEEIK